MILLFFIILLYHNLLRFQNWFACIKESKFNLQQAEDIFSSAFFYYIFSESAIKCKVFAINSPILYDTINLTGNICFIIYECQKIKNALNCRFVCVLLYITGRRRINMSINIMCDYSRKSCGTCKYFQCDDKPEKCGSALVYSGCYQEGICICKTGEYYGQGMIGIYDAPVTSKCYEKLKFEDTATQKAVKSIATKAILKAIFKI